MVRTTVNWPLGEVKKVQIQEALAAAAGILEYAEFSTDAFHFQNKHFKKKNHWITEKQAELNKEENNTTWEMRWPNIVLEDLKFTDKTKCFIEGPSVGLLVFFKRTP